MTSKEKYTENIFLSLGSNLGDRQKNMLSAMQFIDDEIGKISRKSSFYETEAWGNQDQDAFINAVIQLSSTFTAHQVLDIINSIERKLGRVRREKWGPRIIDIDIIYFDDQIISMHDLVVPHPLMQKRKFVLIPLAEIVPEFVHPRLLKKNAELLNECDDQSEVRLIKG